MAGREDGENFDLLVFQRRADATAEYPGRTAPSSTLSLSPAPVRLTDSQNQLVWPSFFFFFFFFFFSFFFFFFFAAFSLCALPLSPGVNLRRREKKT
ncbi:hypothetical protein EYF80_015466 [Liparis tanakae]|uniref:Uncharacterized protein n=1 Tax=Liparis tanakae TaxID=230148 RepID=A0A4Z2IAR3_9TELE|nr:hypothetical protein EYF80_015466 [Liparis tanakae]